MIKLVISDNEGTTTSVPLARDEISIGRKDGNTIRLTERNISREHCRLHRVNGSFLLRDLGSYNGVLLNGQRIAGESEVKPGDEIRIGDYTLQLQAETKSMPPPEAAPKPSPVPRQPARLVVLTAPLAGAEFSLPEKGEARLGRAPELDIAIDHRSVSREHCSLVCDAGEVRIKDNESVNGIIVNRQKVTEARLLSGDVVELGDVVLRFVDAGEHYVFDPEEARALVGGRRRSGKPWPLLAAVGGGGVLLLLFIARLGGGKHEAAPSAPIAPEPAVAAAPLPAVGVAATNAAVAPQPDRFPQLLTACADANRGGRFAEAVAHANAALKVRTGAADAMECLRVAQLNHEQEQILVRAKAAEDAGDREAALKELAGLLPESAVAQRPDVTALVAKLGSEGLERAKQLLKRQPEQASELARQLLGLRLLPSPLTTEANALIARAERSEKADKADKLRSESADRRASTDPRPVRPATPDKSPMEAASACLARGDNACVVRALNGRAQNPQELGLLIETYRAMGDSGQAFRNMALYVQRYPSAKRADTYRQMLERKGQ